MNTEKAIIDHVRGLEKAKAAASVIAALGTTTALAALVAASASLGSSAISEGDVYSDSAVNAGIDALAVAVETDLDLKADNADVETLRTEVEARLDAIEAKVDAILVATKATGSIKS